MTKTKLAFAASLALATLITATSAQAATRQVVIGQDTFANRCVDQGGIFEAASPVLICHTETVQVDCAFATSHDAYCSWPGIDNRIAVNRLLGMADANASSTTGAGGVSKKPGGGVQLPDLPLNNGGGGGGIQLPNLPLNNK